MVQVGQRAAIGYPHLKNRKIDKNRWLVERPELPETNGWTFYERLWMRCGSREGAGKSVHSLTKEKKFAYKENTFNPHNTSIALFHKRLFTILT